MKILVGGSIIVEGQLLKNKALVFDNKIIQMIDKDEVHQYEGEIIPFTGILSPGFIDIHIHGAGGSDTMDASLEALEKISETITASGTISFLATTMTMDQRAIEKSLKNIREFMKVQEKGARCLGAHLEGPFINPKMKGAQDPSFIQSPNTTWIKDYLDIIKMITLAPEMDEGFQFVHELKDKVVLSIGHSNATYDEAKASFKEGVKHVTHCFNAMTGLHHRAPGIVGAAMTSQEVSLDMITDLVHVHPDLFQVFLDIKGRDKFIGITDAMRAAFLEEGEYDLGGQRVFVKDNKCTLEDGTIAGSVHQMDKALRNLVTYTTLSIPEAIEVLSLSPAKLLGLETKGQLKAGFDADFIILDDNLEVISTYVGGEKQ